MLLGPIKKTKSKSHHHHHHSKGGKSASSFDLASCLASCYRKAGVPMPKSVEKNAGRVQAFDKWAAKWHSAENKKAARMADMKAKREAARVARKAAKAIARAAEKARKAESSEVKAKQEAARIRREQRAEAAHLKKVAKEAKAAERKAKADENKIRKALQRARGEAIRRLAAAKREARHAARREKGKPSKTPTRKPRPRKASSHKLNLLGGSMQTRQEKSDTMKQIIREAKRQRRAAKALLSLHRRTQKSKTKRTKKSSGKTVTKPVSWLF